jgi:hypothetical protein
MNKLPVAVACRKRYAPGWKIAIAVTGEAGLAVAAVAAFGFSTTFHKWSKFSSLSICMACVLHRHMWMLPSVGLFCLALLTNEIIWLVLTHGNSKLTSACCSASHRYQCLLFLQLCFQPWLSCFKTHGGLGGGGSYQLLLPEHMPDSV